MNTRRTGRFIEDFPATAGLLLVIIGFFALEMVLHSKVPDDAQANLFTALGSPRTDVLLSMGATRAKDLFKTFEVWRLVSACFLHAGILHLLMNCWVLVDLGRTWEPKLGFHRFIASYMFCGVFANVLGNVYRHLYDKPNVAIGASGALAGLIGMLLAHAIRHKDTALRDHIVRWLIYIALFSFLLYDKLDHAGHIGGLVTGFALGWFVPRYTSSSSAKRWRIPGWIAIAATAVALGFSLWSMFQAIVSWQQGN